MPALLDNLKLFEFATGNKYGQFLIFSTFSVEKSFRQTFWKKCIFIFLRTVNSPEFLIMAESINKKCTYLLLQHATKLILSLLNKVW